MRTQTFLDEAAPTSSRPKREAFKPFDVFIIEKHVPYRDNAFVDFVRVPGENDTFGDYPVH